MLIVLAKSRCMSVGIDQKAQFEPFYLSLMVRRIVDSINFDLLQVKYSHERTKNHWVDKVRPLDVCGITLRLKFNEKDYD